MLQSILNKFPLDGLNFQEVKKFFSGNLMVLFSRNTGFLIPTFSFYTHLCVFTFPLLALNSVSAESTVMLETLFICLLPQAFK